MADKNIQMKKKNGQTWDNMYPITIDSNVFDINGKSISENMQIINNQIADHKPIYIYEYLPSISSHLDGDIVLIYDNLIDISKGAFEMGTMAVTENGLQFSDSTARLRTKRKKALNGDKTLLLINQPNFKTTLNFIDELDNVVYSTAWQEGTFEITIPDATQYFWVVVAKIDNSTITLDEIYNAKPLLVEVVI